MQGARLTAADHDVVQEVEGLKNPFLLRDLKVPENKIETAVEAWKKIHASSGKTNGIHEDANPPSSNGIEPVLVTDTRSFKAGLVARVQGPR